MKISSLFRIAAGLCISSFLLVCTCAAQTAKNGDASPVLTAAKTELDRDFGALKSETIAPYYLSYEIIDSNTVTVAATFGALVQSTAGHHRVAHIDMRVGDYALDKPTSCAAKAQADEVGSNGMVTIPVEDDPLPIRSALWLETDSRYKRALTQFAAVQTNNQVNVEQEDKIRRTSPTRSPSRPSSRSPRCTLTASSGRTRLASTPRLSIATAISLTLPPR